MNSVPVHLLREDHPEYERVLDEALHSVLSRPELTANEPPLNREQLRTMALNATALINTAAAAEYQHYVKVRAELRRSVSLAGTPQVSSSTTNPEPSPVIVPSAGDASGNRPKPGERPDPAAGPGQRFRGAVVGAGRPGSSRFGNGVAAHQWARMSYRRRLLATLLGLHVCPDASAVAGSREASTSGTRAQPMSVAPPEPASTPRRDALDLRAVPVLGILGPVLTGTATVIFLLVGYLVKLLDPESAFARTLLTAGWAWGATTAAAVLATAAWIFLVVPRDRSSAEAGSSGELPDEVVRAGDAWRTALLERGMLPFLQEALGGPPRSASAAQAPTRMPRLGYSSPGFSSPDDGSAAGQGPRFSSPDFTSPDFGGPEPRTK